MKTYSIKNTAGLTLDDLYNYLSQGGRIVTYGYCVSVIAFTYRLISSPHFIKPDEKNSKYRRSYNIRSLLFGWWCLPWGPIYTIDMIKINTKNGGGMDVTTDILIKIKQKYNGGYNSNMFEEDITIDYEDFELRR